MPALGLDVPGSLSGGGVGLHGGSRSRVCVCATSPDKCLGFSQLILCSLGLRPGPSGALLLLNNFLALSVNTCWPHPLAQFWSAYCVPGTMSSTSHTLSLNPQYGNVSNSSRPPNFTWKEKPRFRETGTLVHGLTASIWLTENSTLGPSGTKAQRLKHYAHTDPLVHRRNRGHGCVSPEHY